MLMMDRYQVMLVFSDRAGRLLECVTLSLDCISTLTYFQKIDALRTAAANHLDNHPELWAGAFRCFVITSAHELQSRSPAKADKPYCILAPARQLAIAQSGML